MAPPVQRLVDLSQEGEGTGRKWCLEGQPSGSLGRSPLSRVHVVDLTWCRCGFLHAAAKPPALQLVAMNSHLLACLLPDGDGQVAF